MDEETKDNEAAVTGDHFDEDVDSQKILNFTQRLRREFVREIIQEGMPTEKEERQIFLQTLRDMDTTAIQRTKLDIDQQSVNQDRQVQEAVQKLRELAPRGTRTDHPVRETPPQVDDSVLPDDVQEGELDVGLSNETRESFMERMENGEQ